MSTIITPFNWGEAQVVDLQKVLDSVTDILDSYFEDTINMDVLVDHNADIGPRVLFERGPNNEYQVKLSTKDRVWDQHAYQFSHEYCHIRTNYNNGNQKCKWFEETICELASLFTLRRMAENWAVSPPYQLWRSYGKSLFKYAEDRIIDDKHKLPAGLDFYTWFGANLADLEKDQYIRESNTLIAIELLNLFEKNPKLWVAMKYFNTWNISESDDIFSSFTKWLEVVPDELESCVVKLVDVFKTKA